MSLLMYAIADAGIPLGDVRGLEQRPLLGIADDHLTIVASEHEHPLARATEQSLWDYEQVVERLMERRTILPARFGTVLADPDEGLSTLRLRREEFRQRLEHVRGAVELGLAGSWLDGAPESGAGGSVPDQVQGRTEADQVQRRTKPGQFQSGTEYMHARLRFHQRAQDIEARLEPLRELARGSTIKVLPRPEQPISGAYLVDRERVEQFRHVVGRLAATLDDVTLHCTGPWPPYSFTAGDGR